MDMSRFLKDIILFSSMDIFSESFHSFPIFLVQTV